MSKLISTLSIAALSISALDFSIPRTAQAQVAVPQDVKHFCRALGDSLTFGGSVPSKGYVADFPAFLQQMGTCSVVDNEGVSGQTSTQIAVRSGGLATTATIVGGVIPASGPVAVTFEPEHEPITNYSVASIPVVLSGVPGVLTRASGSAQFIRSNPGVAVPSAPDSPLTIVTGKLNDGFVIIWAGKNNAWKTQEVLSDIASIVAVLPNPKRFVVLSVTNSDLSFQWAGTKLYNAYIQLDTALAEAYPKNFLDIRSLLIADYNPNLPQDVIDHGHDTLPASLRLFTNFNLPTAIMDSNSCAGMPPTGMGATLEIDRERIYISAVNGRFPTPNGCIRGYAGTTAATHLAGTPVTMLDTTHLNASGQRFVAQQINAWLLAHDEVFRKQAR